MGTAFSKHASSGKTVTRLMWKLVVFFLLLGLLLPTLLGKTSLRDVVLNSLVDSDKLRLQSTSASLGYFTPTSVSGLEIKTLNRKSTVSFEQIAGDRSWFSMLASRPDIGKFRIERPVVDITINERAGGAKSDIPSPGKASGSQLLPNLTAQIVDAHLIVRTVTDQMPPIDVSGINATVRLKRKNTLSILSLEPAVIFDHELLTPELCGEGLQLIAPLLADELSAVGEFSLQLTKCELPVVAATSNQAERARATQINGLLELHSASVSMRQTLASRALHIVKELAGISIPGSLLVAENVTVKFSVIDGRVHHSGLALILPHGEHSIEFVSSGSVGIDESLDLTVSIKLPDGFVGRGTVRDMLTSQPILLAVSGTLDSPKLRVSAKQGVLKSFGNLIESVGKDPNQVDPGEVGAAVTDILGDVWSRVQDRNQKDANENQFLGDTEQKKRDAGRTPLLPRFREKEGERGIWPRRGRSSKSDPLDDTR